MAHSDCGWTCGCAGKTVKSPESTYVPYLSASAVVIHYEEALYQVYAPLPLYITAANRVLVRMIDCGQIEANVRWYWLIESKVLLGDWKHAAGNVVDRHTYVHVYRTRTDATATAAAASAAYSAVSISRRVDPQTLQRVPSRRRQTISSESLQSTWFDNFDRHASLHITVCWLCVTEVAATVDGDYCPRCWQPYKYRCQLNVRWTYRRHRSRSLLCFTSQLQNQSLVAKHRTTMIRTLLAWKDNKVCK